MRDRSDLTRAKPPGTCRLAFVGSSIVMGYGVNDDETFPRRLEGRLNAGGPRCQVLNFGAGMSDVLQRRALIDRKVFGFEPDAVYYVAHQDEFLGPAKHLSKLVARRSALRYPYLDDVVREAGVTPDMDARQAEVRLEPFAREVVTGLYRDLVGECRRRGVLPAWVYLPIPGVTNTPAQAAAFAKTAADTGFAVVNLNGWDEGQSPANVMISEAGHHPNVPGHRLIAERLERELRERPGLLPACAARQ